MDDIKPFITRAARGLLILALVAVGPGAGWAQVTEVKMGVAFVSARVAALWVADQEGYFRKHGLDVKLLQIPGGTQGRRRS